MCEETLSGLSQSWTFSAWRREAEKETQTAAFSNLMGVSVSPQSLMFSFNTQNYACIFQVYRGSNKQQTLSCLVIPSVHFTFLTDIETVL